MATRVVDPVYIAQRVSTPPGTLQATPQVVVADLPAGNLESLDLTIPPGHLGFTGFSLRLASATILPYSNPGQFIVGDSLQETFIIGVDIDTGVRVVTYNTGQYPHAFYIRYRIRMVPVASGVPTPALIAPATLASS